MARRRGRSASAPQAPMPRRPWRMRAACPARGVPARHWRWHPSPPVPGSHTALSFRAAPIPGPCALPGRFTEPNSDRDAEFTLLCACDFGRNPSLVRVRSPHIRVPAGRPASNIPALRASNDFSSAHPRPGGGVRRAGPGSTYSELASTDEKPRAKPAAKEERDEPSVTNPKQRGRQARYASSLGSNYSDVSMYSQRDFLSVGRHAVPLSAARWRTVHDGTFSQQVQ